MRTEVVYDSKGYTPAVQLAAISGGEGVSDSKLLDFHSQPLTTEDLEYMSKSVSEEGNQPHEDTEEIIEHTGWTLERLVRF